MLPKSLSGTPLAMSIFEINHWIKEITMRIYKLILAMALTSGFAFTASATPPCAHRKTSGRFADTKVKSPRTAKSVVTPLTTQDPAGPGIGGSN